ncbi:uncharacterized protein DEA37_0011203 [Paragonimus westermani]|uniref:NTR domain-containing protein n=1 Tax=Paragonimus westermani TaxID=34504 RepID=A0A5J4NFX8_9TREM|nr:uncharacterized protein DEA37_0011203 [Paragonimus westermani]
MCPTPCTTVDYHRDILGQTRTSQTSLFSSHTCRFFCLPTAPQCSGCVEDPTYESIISSYCMADVAMKVQILQAERRNSSKGSHTYSLLLDRRLKVFKANKSVQSLVHTTVEVACNCAILDKALRDDPSSLGRWIVMGKLADGSKLLQVEHLSRIRHPGSALKRAIRAIRRRNPKLCHLSLSEASTLVPDKKSKSFAGQRDQSQQLSVDLLLDDDKLNKRFASRRQVRASQLTQPRISVDGVAHSRTATSRSSLRANNRRALVRRSQSSWSKHIVTEPQTGGHTHIDQFRVPRVASRNKNTGKGNSFSIDSYKPRQDVIIETEKELFSPQTLLPWLR